MFTTQDSLWGHAFKILAMDKDMNWIYLKNIKHVNITFHQEKYCFWT